MEVTSHFPIDMCVAQLRKCPSLKKLQLKGIRQRCDDILIAVANHCPHLEELTLDGCTAEEKTIEALVASCTKLKTCELISFDVTSGTKRLGLLCVFSPCHHLQKLTIKDIFCWHSPTSPAQGIPGNYSSLKELTVEGLAGYKWHMEVLTKIGPQLEKLHVDQLGEYGWLPLANWRQVQVLKIENASDLSNESLLDGVGSLTNLRDLKLKAALCLTPEGLRQFLTRKEVVGRLENLSLIGATMSEPCLCLIADNCPALRTLHITYNHEISLDFLRNFISKWVIDPVRSLHIGHECQGFLRDFMAMCRREKGPQVVFHNTGIY